MAEFKTWGHPADRESRVVTDLAGRDRAGSRAAPGAARGP
jgi:hypothetical protein